MTPIRHAVKRAAVRGNRSSLSVRQEELRDETAIAEVIQSAYERVAFSNHREHLMVARLRASRAYIPELSLLAEIAGRMAGHLLLTRINVRDGERSVPSLALAPLSVAPGFQRQGVGSALIHEAHRRARQLGFRSVIVVGITGYYHKFGYVPLHQHPIQLPFEAREENCAVAALCADGLTGLRGVVEYAPEWMEEPT